MKSKVKILLIEDDNMVVNIVSYLLTHEGFEIIVAKDGNEGAEAIENENHDLILMDIVLPYRSGLELTAFAKLKNPNTPIIVLSSLGRIDKTIQEAFSIGVTSVISKPFKPSHLIKKIKTTLSEEIFSTI
jgi:DNA-binding response OmpR family regulator